MSSGKTLFLGLFLVEASEASEYPGVDHTESFITSKPYHDPRCRGLYFLLIRARGMKEHLEMTWILGRATLWGMK